MYFYFNDQSFLNFSRMSIVYRHKFFDKMKYIPFWTDFDENLYEC